MTLYKQMALLISMVLLLILSAIMVLSFQNANRAVQEGLYEDAKNTASSLSLSLGTAEGDTGTMETMINANFDSGHYVRIALLDMDDALIFERIAEQSRPDVPEWFLQAITIHAPEANAQVSAGWNPVGMLFVQSDPSSAYVQLYRTFRDLLLSFGLIALISLIVLNALLHVVLKPLKSVQSQAEAILHNRFIFQERIPFTTEFKDVVKGMNAMVTKVKEIFEKGNEAMARNRELMYNDPVTKLFNRRYLMLKLPEILELANERNGGMMMMVAFEGAEVVNQKLGRQKADDFFRSLGEAFEKLATHFDEHIVARVNGTEFAMLLPNCESDEGSDIARRINRAMKKLKETHGLEAHDCDIKIGLFRYVSGLDIPTLMTKVDYALTHAKAREDDNTYLFESKDEKNAMGKEQWRSVIANAINHDFFHLAFWPVLDTRKSQMIQKVMTFTIHDADDTIYSYGNFAPEAIALGQLPQMYLVALRKLFEHPPHESAGEYSIRLSTEFVKSPQAFEQLRHLLEHYSKAMPFKLAFEISDAIVLKNLELVRQFDALFDSFGCRVGINQFSGQSRDYTYLQEIRPQFIKADVAFFLDQSKEGIHALQLMGDSMGIELIATGVRTPEQLEKLQELGIKTIQGMLAETLLAH